MTTAAIGYRFQETQGDVHAINDSFIPFGSGHLLAILLIAVASIGLPLLARHGATPSAQRTAGRLLAILLVAGETTKIALLVAVYDRPLVDTLPLHLCSAATLLTAYVLARQSYAAFEIVYFWVFGGTLQAVLTPDLQIGFPSLAFLAFFVGHGLTILGTSYAIVVYRFRPILRSVWRAISVTAGYAVVVGLLNIPLGTNYLYLQQKPARASLMDYLGPWPWYLLSLVGVGVVACVLLYLPFALLNRTRAGGEARGD